MFSHKHKAGWTVLSLCALTCGLTLSCAPVALAKKSSSLTKEESFTQALHTQAQGYTQAFARSDAKALAQYWTEDGSLVSCDGTLTSNRNNIEKLFSDFFAANHSRKITINQESFKTIAPDLVIETGTTSLEGERGESFPKTRYVAVQKKVKGNWLIQNLTETELPAPPAAAKYSLQDLDFLLGVWQAKNDQTQVKLKSNWQADKHFIVSQFVCKSPDKEQTEMLVSTYNPKLDSVISFIFDSEGGYGRGIWYKDGGTWIFKAMRTEPSGSVVFTKNSLTKMSDNKLSWQSLVRRIDGINIGGAPAIEIEKALEDKTQQ